MLALYSAHHGTMVYGRGTKGGRGRCFGLWQEFSKCLEHNGKYKLDVCQLQREDYLECLHHTKLVSAAIYY